MKPWYIDIWTCSGTSWTRLERVLFLIAWYGGLCAIIGAEILAVTHV